jgi:CheY-like chemotaxis protein
VHVTHSGAEALTALGSIRPEVIFLDLGMPGMDGFETARRLRRVPDLDATLLVAMTGYGQDAAREQARQVGFDEYLVKPAHPDVVRALARKARTPDPSA